MGTRNLTCVHVDGDYPIAQYCQWDGYPAGQGKIMYDYLTGADPNAAFDEAELKRVLADCEIISDEELKQRWARCGGIDADGWTTPEVAARFKSRWPHLDRDMGAGVVPYVQNNGPLKLKSSLDFAGDSLFCEWAYVLDLDKSTFEVYAGFNKAPLCEGERFRHMDFDESGVNGTVFYPVRYVIGWSLNALPETSDDFVNSVEQAYKEHQS